MSRRIALAAGRIFRFSRVPAIAARALPASGFFGKVRLGLAMLAASAAPRLEAKPIAAAQVAAPRPLSEKTPVALLTGCVQEGLFARVNRATERVLEANSYSMRRIGGQGCCGALHAHAGRLPDARELARANVDAFFPLIERGEVEAVVVNAAGCSAAMSEYGHLLADDPEYATRARRVAERVRDVSELLADRGPRQGAPLGLKVAYDSPCHLEHAQRIVSQPVAVLDAIPGLERVPLDGADECCGGAGIYGITHPELGGQIGGDKVDAVERSGAEVLSTGNPGCMMQIGAGLRMRGSSVEVAHPVELLDMSYRAAGFYERIQS